jgi:hypothetical protein
LKKQVRCAGLPLTVYREVAAHLQQVDGVQTTLVSQRSHPFDYNQSQIESLWIHYAASASEVARERVQQILTYYGDRFGHWETLAEVKE